MRTLFASSRTFRQPPPVVGCDVIQCGPRFSKRKIGDRWFSIPTTGRDYDLSETVSLLPPEQRPDVVACLLEGSADALPRNVRISNTPSLLLIGRIEAESIDKVVSYASRERFDRIVLTCSLALKEALQTSGVQNLYWAPGLCLPLTDEMARRAVKGQRRREISVIADPGLTRLDGLDELAALIASHVPFRSVPSGWEQLFATISSSAMVTSPTATAGDLDEASWLALACGALVFVRGDIGTLQACAMPSQACIAYSEPTDLIQKIQHFLNHPEDVVARVQRAACWCEAHLSEQARTGVFHSLTSGRGVDAFEVEPLKAPTPRVKANRSIQSHRPIGRSRREVAALLEQGNLQDALTRAREAIQQEPKSADGFITLAEIARLIDNRPLALQMLEKARSLPATDALVPWMLHQLSSPSGSKPLTGVLTNAAWDAYFAKDYSRARQLAAQALSLQPEDPGAFHLIGLVLLDTYSREKDYAELYTLGEALTALNTAVTRSPTASHLRELAVASRSAGLIPEASAAFRAALELEPEEPVAAYGLAESLFQAGKLPECKALLEQLIQRRPDENRVLNLLGCVLKRLGRHLEAAAHFARACGRVEPWPGIISRNKRRVIFLAQHPPMWTNTASVYAAFAADPDWEVTVVALPYRMHAFTGRYDASMAIFGFLKDKGVPHVRWDEFELKNDIADVIFVENPYDYSRPDGWSTADLLAKVPRLVYIPYALEVGGGAENTSYQTDLLLQRTAWSLCARSERERAYFARHCSTGSAHVAVTGHPRVDAMHELELARDPVLQARIEGRRVILWNPHLDVRLNGTSYGRGFSTFLHWRDVMLDEFEQRPDLVLLIRPHPQLFPKLHQYGILTQRQIDNYLARCSNLQNVILDEGASYLPALAAAHAMISDVSSLILEYSLTGRPLLYLKNPHGPGLNFDGDEIIRHHRTAESILDLREFIDYATTATPSAAARQIAENLLPRPPDGAGALIKTTVEARLTAEVGVALERLENQQHAA